MGFHSYFTVNHAIKCFFFFFIKDGEEVNVVPLSVYCSVKELMISGVLTGEERVPYRSFHLNNIVHLKIPQSDSLQSICD